MQELRGGVARWRAGGKAVAYSDRGGERRSCRIERSIVASRLRANSDRRVTSELHEGGRARRRLTAEVDFVNERTLRAGATLEGSDVGAVRNGNSVIRSCRRV